MCNFGRHDRKARKRGGSHSASFAHGMWYVIKEGYARERQGSWVARDAPCAHEQPSEALAPCTPSQTGRLVDDSDAILREPFRGHVRLNKLLNARAPPVRTILPRFIGCNRLLRARGVIHTCVDVLLRARIERLHRERKKHEPCVEWAAHGRHGRVAEHGCAPAAAGLTLA